MIVILTPCHFRYFLILLFWLGVYFFGGAFVLNFLISSFSLYGSCVPPPAVFKCSFRFFAKKHTYLFSKCVSLFHPNADNKKGKEKNNFIGLYTEFVQ